MADPQKKMNVVQLTFIVTVNMMGSGIIMLPTNMAQVGAISLLSWIVTAVGSMAIAYGFAQAGIFNQRSGGMAAYAEDAYGKAGYFQVFFLYFLSLAIANVAVASSALGYLAAFFPALSASPAATCAGVVGLLWLTTVANFGGPKLTGRIGSVTVWGVILPVGFMSIFGWFWFRGSIFSEAWNPKGLSLAEGMGSSISLTLWAFLGMESASQNASAVENPKRDVPLACLFGTLGAAAVYILSTTVIQGVVPNAELAKSTGPFGLAFAHMFSPTLGSIVMALAAMACVGSLLGWQFTLASTAKDAADTGMFPAIFGKANAMGAPIAGMVIMGIVQSLMALSTISPNLSEQFAALVNLAVVTNVVPYIVALSALTVIMKNAGVASATYNRNLAIAVVAIAYSVYALWASGKDAVMGGMLVMGLGWLIWTFMAPRFAMATARAAAALAVVVLASANPGRAQEEPSAPQMARTTSERVRSTGRLALGYAGDARPFSYRDASGKASGFAVGVCEKVAEQLKTGLGISSVVWVPVGADGGTADLKAGRVDLLCSGSAVTAHGRESVSYSIPIFENGIGALMRADGSAQLRAALEERRPPYQPLWRGSIPPALERRTFAVVEGSPAAELLAERIQSFGLVTSVSNVQDYAAGVARVLDRTADALFGSRANLLDAAKHSSSPRALVVLSRHYRFQPIALALERSDEDFRLAVDTALSRVYASPDFGVLYSTHFGEADPDTVSFYRMSALPE